MYDQVLLVTCAELPEGEPDGHRLLEAFRERGIAAYWVGWDDPDVDWTDGLVALRSPWDYDLRRREFLDWVRTVPRVLNGSPTFVWNTDKGYLLDLAGAGLPVVPTEVVDGAGLADAVRRWPEAVVKPTVGAGGRGVEVVRDGMLPLDPDPEHDSGRWLVQPLVESVRTEGETSVFVFGGQAATQVRKVPPAGQIPVHEHLGGRCRAAPLDAEAAKLGNLVVDTASELLERHLDYARVDLMRMPSGELVVSELEVTEPGLYLDVLPENAALFADLVQTRL